MSLYMGVVIISPAVSGRIILSVKTLSNGGFQMTTEIINQREILTAAAVSTGTALANLTLPALKAKTRSRKNGAGTRPDGFKTEYKAGDAQILNKSLSESLELHAREKDGWERSMSATMALLKQAHGMIEHAEDVIFHQEKRIRELERLPPPMN